jgi:hypothetical protein
MGRAENFKDALLKRVQIGRALLPQRQHRRSDALPNTAIISLAIRRVFRILHPA